MVRPLSITPQARVSLRAGLCLVVPLLIGLFTDERVVAAFVAIGVLWAVGQDGVDRWRNRVVRLTGVAILGGAGVVLGSLELRWFHGTTPLWTFLAVIALIAGVIETTFLPSPGMFFLLGAIVGSGLHPTGLTWQPGLLVMCGGFFVTLVAMITDRRSHRQDQRLCLAAAYAALSKLTASLGRSTLIDARPQAVFALDIAQSALSEETGPVNDAEATALRDCFLVALQVGELVSVLRRKSIKVDAEFSTALSSIGTTLRSSSALEARDQLATFAERMSSETATALSAPFSRALRPSFGSDTQVLPLPLSGVERLPLSDRLRFATLLTLATFCGVVVTHALHGTHAFWLPLSVAFIFRPDLGPVIPRAVARTAGTMAGVGLAALVALLGNSPLALIVLCAVMASIVPWASRRSHALSVFAFTPIVFVFLAAVGPDQSLFVPRIIDTALAAGIVLVVDVMLWSRAPSLRPLQQLARAQRATESFEARAATVSPVMRHQLRRDALRAVAFARAGLRQTQNEPHPLRHPDEDLSYQLDALERRIDDRTASVVGFIS